ncbi:hypothetical protein GCM10018771_45260 [Streptomyces cellulosae]|nr:hypothetical protein GCM10018771_45260 [Streptomyces cellulosae]
MGVPETAFAGVAGSREVFRQDGPAEGPEEAGVGAVSEAARGQGRRSACRPGGGRPRCRTTVVPGAVPECGAVGCGVSPGRRSPAVPQGPVCLTSERSAGVDGGGTSS